MRRALSLLFVAPLLATAAAASSQGALRVSVSSLVDTNVSREFSGGDAPLPKLDTGLFATGQAEGRLTGERTQVAGSYQVGARGYFRFPEESMWVQAGRFEGLWSLGRLLAVGAEGRAKDRRGSRRAYSDGVANLFLEFVPDLHLDLRVYVQAHRFLYWPALDWSYGAGEVGFTSRYRFNRQHALLAFAELGQRRYASALRLPPLSLFAPAPGRREDSAWNVGASYLFRGPVNASLGYTFQGQDSNSFGETVLRHRLQATLGLRLPAQFTLLAQGTLGLNRYPDRVFLSPDLVLLEDDEAQNALSLRLVRPVSAHWDVELSYGLYAAQLPKNQLSYLRQVLALGLTWRN